MKSREPNHRAREIETEERTWSGSSPVYADPAGDPQRRPQILLLVTGLVGFVIGVFLWGSLFLILLSAGQVGDPPTSSNDAQEATPREAPLIDCAELAERGSLSPGEQALFEEQCDDAADAPEDEDAPQPQEVLNRENCSQIRGTEYHSAEERAWFLANCVNNQGPHAQFNSVTRFNRSGPTTYACPSWPGTDTASRPVAQSNCCSI